MPCINEDGKKLYCDSYKDVVQQLTILQPLLTPHEVSLEAARIFRPRYRIDKKSEKNEIAGFPDNDGVPFSLTPDGEVFFPTYGPEGKLLEEVHLSQLRQRPKEYSFKDHQTSLLVQRAFQEGATIVRTVYGREGDDNRDIVEMDYNPVTNQGLLKVKNTEQNGKLHSFSEIRNIAKKINPHLSVVKPSENTFVLTDKPLKIHHVQETIHTAGIAKSRYKGIYQSDVHLVQSRRLDVLKDGEKPKISPHSSIDKVQLEPVSTIARSVETLRRKASKDTHLTLVVAGAFLLDRWRRKQEEKKEERKSAGVVRKKESFALRIWNKLFEKPKALVLQRKEKAIASMKEKRVLPIFDKKIVKNRLVGVVEKTVQAIEQPKKVVETIITQVKRIPDKVAGILQEKKALIIKNIDTSIRPPLLKIKERVVHAVFSFKEKAKKSIKTTGEVLSQVKTKVKERAFGVFKFLQSKWFSQGEKPIFPFGPKNKLPWPYGHGFCSALFRAARDFWKRRILPPQPEVLRSWNKEAKKKIIHVILKLKESYIVKRLKKASFVVRSKLLSTQKFTKEIAKIVWQRAIFEGEKKLQVALWSRRVFMFMTKLFLSFRRSVPSGGRLKNPAKRNYVPIATGPDFFPDIHRDRNDKEVFLNQKLNVFEKRLAFNTLFWIWLLWQKWLRAVSELKSERPQGLAFGSPRSHPPAQHVKGVIYSVEMSRLRGSVSVA